MLDSKGKYRSYVETQCPDCQRIRNVRKDGVGKITGRCQSCASFFKWNDNFRKQQIEKHLGKKSSEETKQKISKALKGKIPKNLAQLHKKHKKEKGMASLKHLFNTYKASAKERGYVFDLSFDEVKKLTSNNCFYCGQKPNMKRKPHNTVNGEYIYNGIDRIDNVIGYEIENCVSCCTHCNYAKHTMTIKEFRKWMKQVYKHTIMGSRQITVK